MEVEISEDKLINKKLICHRFFTIALIIEDILGTIKKFSLSTEKLNLFGIRLIVHASKC